MINSIKPKTSHFLHIIMSILTLGLWLPVWALVSMHNSGKARDIDVKYGQREKIKPDKIGLDFYRYLFRARRNYDNPR